MVLCACARPALVSLLPVSMRVRSESACLVSVRACALRGGCAVAEVSCVSALALFRRADDAEKRKLNQAGTYRFKIKTAICEVNYSGGAACLCSCLPTLATR